MELKEKKGTPHFPIFSQTLKFLFPKSGRIRGNEIRFNKFSLKLLKYP